MTPASYREDFDEGTGGWYGWISNSGGPRRLELRNGAAVSGSPWWIDYNHAPPGAGYLHMVYCLQTRGPEGEHQYETAGRSRFISGGHSRNLEGAQVRLRLRGELERRGAELTLLLQGNAGGLTSGWLLTGRPFGVSREWTEPSAEISPDPALWTCLGARHDRTDMYGRVELTTVLRDVNVNLMLVLFPLTIAPMGPLDGDPHRLRAGKDYPVWTSKLPEGYIELDWVQIDFANH